MHLATLSRSTMTMVTVLLVTTCLAQFPDIVPGTYTDVATNISFVTYSTGPFTFGIALPQDATTKNATEYIGLLRCVSPASNSSGWCGISHAGHMTQDLLLMAWPYQNQVLTSFRYIDDYFQPPPYHGNTTTLTQIRSAVNSTGFEVLYRCRDCFSWMQGNYSESVATAGEGPMLIGYALAAQAPRNPSCPERISFDFHESGFGQWAVEVANATRPSYTAWAAQATKTVSASCTGSTARSVSRHFS